MARRLPGMLCVEHQPSCPLCLKSNIVSQELSPPRILEMLKVVYSENMGRPDLADIVRWAPRPPKMT